MGAGKTSVLNELKELNYICIDEPARQILAEQRLIKGSGVPEINAELFTELMLSRIMFQYKMNAGKSDLVFFDRGIPDIAGYADLFGINNEIYMNASKEYRFNKNVFLFVGIEEIYVNDEERKMSFELADKFGKDVRKIYESLDYIVHEVPFTGTKDRTEFILKKLKII